MKITVLVPEDRVGEFEIARSALTAGRPWSEPSGGSSASTWVSVETVIPSEVVAPFYEQFAKWVRKATDTVELAEELTEKELPFEQFFHLPRLEREFLLLLSDDGGRVVGWPELKLKCGLSGKPSASLALPHLDKLCSASKRRLPVRLSGEDDAAAFTLAPPLVPVIHSYGLALTAGSPPDAKQPSVTDEAAPKTQETKQQRRARRKAARRAARAKRKQARLNWGKRRRKY